MKPTVLIVEDDPDISRVLRLALGSGYAFTSAGDLAQARAWLDTGGRPDVALLDVGLPDGSGLTLCHELRSREPSCAVVVVTALAHVAPEAWSLGAHQIVLKPFDPDEVAGLVARLVGQRSTNGWAGTGASGR